MDLVTSREPMLIISRDRFIIILFISPQGLRLSVNGYSEDPLVSGAAWQRARSSPSPRNNPASSHARPDVFTVYIFQQLLLLMSILLPYVHRF